MAEEKKAAKDAEQLSDESLEQAAGGIIEGGCIVYPPILKPTTDPIRTGDFL